MAAKLEGKGYHMQIREVLKDQSKDYQHSQLGPLLSWLGEGSIQVPSQVGEQRGDYSNYLLQMGGNFEHHIVWHSWVTAIETISALIWISVTKAVVRQAI